MEASTHKGGQGTSEPDIDLKELGARLRQLRIAKFGPDQSDADFQKVSEVSRGSVGPIERGEGQYGPSIVVLDRWVRACGSTLRDFFGAPRRKDFQLPFDFDPNYTELHQLLSEILEDGDSELLKHMTFVLGRLRSGPMVQSERKEAVGQNPRRIRKPRKNQIVRKVESDKPTSRKPQRPA